LTNALECGVGFRQLRAYRRARPGLGRLHPILFTEHAVEILEPEPVIEEQQVDKCDDGGVFVV
jgi:hypothetical protein